MANAGGEAEEVDLTGDNSPEPVRSRRSSGAWPCQTWPMRVVAAAFERMSVTDIWGL
eukprot:COSAG02_NODE_769_length_17369_cov_8.151013_11_plen_57_part_00